MTTNTIAPHAGASTLDTACLTDHPRIGRLLVAIHPRELLRGFLTSWLCTLNRDFEIISAPAATALAQDVFPRACATVIGLIGMDSMAADEWLRDQIALLRAARPKMPVIVMCEDDIGEKYACMNLQAYIPTSSTVELAAAAINLVTVGGCYIPYAWEALLHLKGPLPTRSAAEPDPAASTLLTPREEAVLDLLQRGMPNKVIAHKLGISQSTVKAHVHAIIGKLDVHNRTEAAMTAHRIHPSTPKLPNSAPVSSRASTGAEIVRSVNGAQNINVPSAQAGKRHSH